MPHMSSLKFRFFLVLTLALLAISPARVQAQAENSNAASRLYNNAAERQNLGQYDVAAQKWNEFIQKFPNDSRLDNVHYFLGLCLLKEKNFPEANKAFEIVISKYPKSTKLAACSYNRASALYQLAVGSKKSDDYKIAARAFADTANQHKATRYGDMATYYQGESLYSAGDAAGSTAAYDALIKNFPKSSLLADAYYALGTTQQELGQDEAAARTYSDFLSKKELASSKIAPEIGLRYGMSLFNQKKYNEAEKLFDSAAKVPNFQHAPFALLRQAQCQLEKGKVAEAANLFVELPKKFPKSPYRIPAELAAGRCFYQTDRLDDARKLLEPIAKTKSNEAPEAAYWLGRTLLKLDNPQDAVAVLDAAVASFKEGPFAAYLQVARLDAMFELPERRVQTQAPYADFARQNPDHPLAGQAAYMSALVALGRSDYAQARSQGEAFLANSKFAHSELTPAVLYIAAEGYLLDTSSNNSANAAKAEALYRLLVSKHPEHSRAARSHLRIGWCLYQAKKFQEAGSYLQTNFGKLTQPDHKAEAQLLLGRSLSGQKKETEALAAFDKALKENSEWERSDEVLAAAAQCERSLNNIAGAKSRLERLVKDYPQSELLGQAIYHLGEISQGENKSDAAVARYREVINRFADSEFSAPARYGIAACLFAKEDYNGAITSLNELLTNKVEADITSRAQYLRGVVYQRLKKPAEAVKDLEAFLSSSPTGDLALDARCALALGQVELGQFDQANASVTALLQAKSDYAHADKIFYEMGHALLQQKKEDEAIASFKQLVEKLPKSRLVAECYFHLGRQHEEKADATKADDAKKVEIIAAAKLFESGLASAKDKPMREKLQYKLGDMQFRQDLFEQAAQTLQAQIHEHPNGELVGPGRFLAAECLFRLNKRAEALPLFDKVIKDKVAHYEDDALYRAGECAADSDKWPESQQYYTTLVAQFKDYQQVNEARYGIVLALIKQKKLDEAKPICEQIVDSTESETAAKAFFTLGEIAFARGEMNEAIDHFLNVAVGYPYPKWKPLARFEAGRCFMELKQYDKAIKSLERVIKEYPDHEKVKDCQKLIAAMQK